MKNLLIVALMLLSLSSFGQNNEAKYKEALIAHNKNVVTHFYDALQRKEYDQLKGVIDFNGKAVLTDQSQKSSETIEGRDAIGAFFKNSVDGYYKVKFSTKLNVGEDPELVTVKVKGALLTANGVKTEKVYLATFRFKNGKIVEYTEYNSAPESVRS